VVLLLACGDDASPDAGCVEGRSTPCLCADGSTGAMVCDSDGVFGSCSCPDAGAGDAGEAGVDDAGVDADLACDGVPPFPDPPLHVCADATRTCIGMCPDYPCIRACIDADPDRADCHECLESLGSAFHACTVENGCGTQWQALICCVNEHCPGDETLPCIDTGRPCEAARTAFDDCAGPLIDTCADSASSCYP
jgi:hypothetical protein